MKALATAGRCLSLSRGSASRSHLAPRVAQEAVKERYKKSGQASGRRSFETESIAAKLDIQKQGESRYNIEEAGCSYFHGVSCSFDEFVNPAE